MYTEDALLRHTRSAAAKIMRLVNSQPQGARAAVVQDALNSVRPGLYEQVDRVAKNYVERGFTAARAYEEAIHLALADTFMAAVKALARAKETGRTDDEALEAQRMFYGQLREGGLGDLGDGLGNAARDAGNFALNTLRAAACSTEVRDLILNAIPGEGARTATSAGLSVAKGVSACSRMPGATSAPPPAPAPSQPSPPPPPPKDNTMLYLGIGGAVLGLGVIAFFALRKK